MLKTLKGALLAGALTAVCALSSAGAVAETITLKVAHLMAPVAALHQKVLEPWCATLSKESDGRIACQIYPSMTLGGTPAQLADMVKNGVADVVWTVPGYTAGRFPVLEAMELPFVARDAVSGSRAVWAFVEKYQPKELSAYKVLAVSIDGGMALHTASRPLNNVNDIAGLKLRASGRLMAKTLSALGATPVAMPTPQITEAVSKGVVDGLLGAWELIRPFKLDEVTRYHFEPAAGQAFPNTAVVMLLMNKQRYESLPGDLKAIVDRHSGAPLVETFGQVWAEETTGGRDKVRMGGGNILTFSDADYQAMRERTKPVETEWVADMTAKGFPGQEMVDTIRALAGSSGAGSK